MTPVAAAPETQDFAVMGGVLRSELEFPELQVVRGAEPNWVLRVADCEVPPAELSPLGARSVGREHYLLWKSTKGFRLEYSHAGTFDIHEAGAAITWYPSPDARPELARAIVLGSALAIALELQGCLCLHGSAVAIQGRAIAFLGSKHHGKSTLAMALVASGGKLISDDLLAVAPDPPPRLRAGVPSVRLWEDAAAQLDVAGLCDGIIPGIKMTAHGFTGRVISAETLIDTIYILSPVGPGASLTCSRSPVRGAAAVISLAHQTKLPDCLVGLEGSVSQLRLAARVSSTVPVWALSVARDFALLPKVVDQIIGWHLQKPLPSVASR